MSGNRHDAVWIRRSTDEQEDEAQAANVGKLLAKLEKTVPSQWWFHTVVSRRKVTSDPKFKEMMALVEADEVETIYVETHDRLGITKLSEFFALKELLIEHKTKLFDLTNARELTDEGIASEVLSFLGIHVSREELEKIAQRSLRSRLNNFKERGTWPTGAQPFGFAKTCIAATGDIRWEWHPSSRARGQIFNITPNGTLVAGEQNTRIPRKPEKSDTIKLIAHRNEEHVKTVQLIFDLYTRAGLSRRAISARLNAEGRRYYDRPFTHSLVTLVLGNAAYVGDTHFGKTQSGELRTFNEEEIIVKAEPGKSRDKRRPVEQQVVVQNTHTGLITRATWEAALAKMAAERERTTYSSINPAYYLKQLFVCGHCGKNMTGRTDNDPRTKKKTVYYVCSSYQVGRTSGQTGKCGYHRITHAAAEQLLLNKMEELNVQFEQAASKGVRANLVARLKQLRKRFQGFEQEWTETINGGVDALVEYLGIHLTNDYHRIKTFRRRAHDFFWGDDLDDDAFATFGLTLEQFSAVVRKAEDESLAEAKARVADLEKKHKRYTDFQVEATDEQRPHIKATIDELEQELKRWRPRTKPITEQLNDLYADELKRQAERKALLDEWPTIEGRERGEAFRRIFKTVELYWDAEFRQAAGRPTRERKTDRPGRWNYTLNEGKICWAYAPSNLGGSW